MAIVTEVVGLLFGIQPNCAAAAALTTEIGANLSYDLQPRPVSVVAVEKSSNTLLTMGPKANGKFSAEARARMEDRRPEGRDTGHLVVTSTEHLRLLDPNMRQLESYGVKAPSIMIRVKSVDPESGEWPFEWQGLQLLYILDEENRALIPAYEAARQDLAARAKIIAADIRAGRSLDLIVARAR
ncbi:hypothetical protein H490_0101565 [Leucobacter sp. UCD-THU]|nr:hypothetical protein H490_0101565 [Leucobacter sp. UCD-THU]